jgi:PAS domain S-box-containing protein
MKISYNKKQVKSKKYLHNFRYREDVLKKIFRNIQFGIIIYHLENIKDDRTLRLVSANPRTEKFLGIKIEDIVGKTIDENFPNLREQKIPQKFTQVIKTQKPANLEDVIYKDNRIEGAYAVKVFPLPDQHVGVCFEDITEKKKIEIKLKQSEETLKFLVDATFEGISITKKGTIMMVNKALVKMFGYSSKKELIGQFGPNFFNKEYQPEIARRAVKNIPGNYEAIGKRKDGSEFPLEVEVKTMPYKGEMVRVAAIRDITERKKSEQKIFDLYRNLAVTNTKISILRDMDQTKFSKSEKQFFKFIVKTAQKLSDAHFCLLYKYQKHKQKFKLIAKKIRKKNLNKIRTIKLKDYPFIQKVIDSKLRFQGNTSDYDLKDLNYNRKIKGFVILPIKNKVIHSVLILGYTKKDHITTQELSFYDLFCNHISFILNQSHQK